MVMRLPLLIDAAHSMMGNLITDDTQLIDAGQSVPLTVCFRLDID